MKSAILTVVLSLGIGSAGAATQPAPVQHAEKRSAVLEALLAGRDARPAMGDAVAQGHQAQSSVGGEPSRAIAGYEQKLRNLAAALEASSRTTTIEAARKSRTALRAALAELPAQRMLLDARMESIDRGGSGLPATAQQRWARQRAQLMAQVDGIEVAARDLDGMLSRLSDYSDTPRAPLAELRERIALALPSDTPIYGALPLQRPRLPTRAPSTTVVKVPAYLVVANEVAPEAADIASDVEAPLSPAILSKAASLGHDYARIVDFVRSEVRTQWYAGAQKGADATLRTLAGNDVDQASLLIALLRASGAPARYVRGVVEVPVEDLVAMLGVRSDKVGQALSAAGIANEPVARAGRVAAYALDQIYVDAYLPLTNYRGTSADLTGRTWLPLAPALKPHHFRAAGGALAKATINTTMFVTQYLNAPQTLLPLDLLRQQATDALSRLAPPLSYASQLAEFDIDAAPLELLPASLPYPSRAATDEFARLPEDLRQHVRIVVRENADANGAVLLDRHLAVSDIVGRRVTVSYQPASIDDGRIADRYGGIGATPPYLIHLTPRLNIAGSPAAQGTGEIESGTSHRIEVTLEGPAGSTSFSQQLTAGGLAAIAFDAQGDDTLEQTQTELLIGESESDAARLLANFGARYLKTWDDADTELAQLVGVSVIRPLPSAALVLNQYHVDSVGGVVDALTWKGVAIDAALHAVEPFAQGNDAAAESDWMQLSGLHGSTLEHTVFEQQWNVESISADKGLALARQNNVPVLTLTGATGTSGLNQPQAVVDAVNAWLQQGFVVDIPRDPITFKYWTGAVWRVRALSSGESGYFIAGRLAGGATAMPPEAWYYQDLMELLANPYASPPNDDPMSAVLISLDETAQQQDGIVDHVLGRELKAVLFDESGRPVRGALVKFAVVEGSAHLLDEHGAEVAQVMVPTDRYGFAHTRLKLGKRNIPGVFAIEEGTEFPQFFGYNAIEVSAASSIGTLVSGQPYRAYARPDQPMKIWVDGDSINDLVPGMGYRALDVRVLDDYDNEVSNAEVTLSTTTEYRSLTCAFTPPHVDTIDAKLFTPDSHCPSEELLLTGHACTRQSLFTKSRPGGAPFYVVPPKTGLATVNVEAKVAGTPADKSFPLHTLDELVDQCTSDLAWSIHFWAHAPVLGFAPARLPTVLDAAAPDTVMSAPQRVDLWTGDTIVGDHPYIDWHPNNSATFEPHLTGGSLENTSSIGNGSYLLYQRAGAQPGPIDGDINLHWQWGTRSAQTAIGGQQRVTSNGFFGWSVKLDPPTVEPARVPLTPYGATEVPIRLKLAMAPSAYLAPVRLELLKGDEVIETCGTPLADGTFYCDLHRGYLIDPSKTYKVRATVNDGNPFRMESATTEVKFGRGVLAGYGVIPPWMHLTPLQAVNLVSNKYPQSIEINANVDIASGYVCEKGNTFAYVLEQPSHVSLTFYKLDHNGDPTHNEAWKALDNVPAEAGYNELPIDPSKLPLGEFTYELVAVADNGGATETKVGVASHEVERHDALPLAHPIVKGIDLFSGSATLSEDDIVVGGRGPGMKLTRTYSSHQGNVPGYFGRGWSSDLDSKVTVNGCDTRIVTGSSGQGQLFLPAGLAPDGARLFTPQFGYHGTLEQRGDDYDFYGKDGTHYHFGQPSLDGQRLSFVEDTNGNRVAYEYDLNQGEPRVTRITDAAGRSITFYYAMKDVTRTQSGFTIRYNFPVVTGALGPGNLLARYEYDDFGNLTGATLSGDNAIARHSGYGYQNFGLVFDGLKAYLLGWRLTSASDVIAGTSRTYEYQMGWSAYSTHTDNGSVVANLVPEERVKRFKDADDAKTEFIYPELRGQGPVTTDVTDARGKPTHYAMEVHGAATLVHDPLGHDTLTEWDVTHLQPSKTTDAIGTITTYTYDSAGNQTSQKIEHPTAGSITRSWTYYAPGDFDAPYVKQRVKDAIDGNRHTTHFAYDRLGNLTETVRGGVTEHDSYDANGDHASHTDGRGKSWTFRYDQYGYPREAEDPLHRITRTTYDVRGRKLSETDPAGATTTTTWDDLDRPLVTTLPTTEAGTGKKTMVYDDANRMRRETNPRGKRLLTELDPLGRVLRVTRHDNSYKVLEYDENGNTKSESDFSGNVTTFVYDDANRLTDKHEPEGRDTHNVYDAVGHVTQTTVGSGADARTTKFKYEHPLYQRTEVRRDGVPPAADAIETTIYDDVGNVKEKIDAEQRHTTLIYDDRDRLTSQTEPLGRVVTFDYDEADHKRLETRANPSGSSNQVREWIYDDAGQVVETVDAENGHRKQRYDDAGNVISKIDALAHATTLTYDARHSLLTETGPEAGQLTTYHYDLNGNRIRETWANGRAITHTYDDLDRRTKSVDDSTIEELTYLPDGEVWTRTDANGHLTRHTYDHLHRRTASDLPPVDGQPRQVVIGYNVHNDVTSETDAGHHVTTHVYNTLGQKTDTVLPDDGENGTATLHYFYDLVGNLLSQSNARGQATVYTVDPLNRRKTQTDPQDANGVALTQKWDYDEVGNVIRHEDRRGISTYTAYDKENRPTGTMRDALLLETRKYDAQGNVEVGTDAEKRSITFLYDKANRKVGEDRPLNAHPRWTYTPLGDIASATDADAKTTVYEYDKRRRLASETNAAAETTTYEYDGEGHRTLVHRPMGKDWKSTYDAADRLATVKDPDGHTTTYTYDLDGNRTRIKDANDHETVFEYDGRHHLTSKTYPTTTGTAVHRWQYDADGNVHIETTPNGRTLTSTWDPLNRRTRLEINAPIGSPPSEVTDTRWTYDGNGNVVDTVQVSNGTWHEQRVYDKFDRLEHVEQVGHQQPLDYRYDKVGNRTGLTDSDGKDTTWSFDALNRNTGITVVGQGTTQLEYTLGGHPTTITRPDGSTSTTEYDNAWRVQTITHAKAGSTIARYAYRYDFNGNRLEQRETNGGAEELTEYTYDDNDRLTEVRAPDRTTHYTLDPVGNRTHETVTAGAATISDSTLTYNERDQLTRRRDTVRNLDLTLAYDADGNEIRTTEGALIRTLHYDARDRMIAMDIPGQDPLTFVYDPAGLRIVKSDGTTSTGYQYDQGSLLAETNNLGNTFTRYHYGATQLLSRTQGVSTPVQRHYLLDALKSPIALLTQEGALNGRTQYDAFGLIRKQVGTDGSVTTPDLDGDNAELPNADQQAIGYTGYVKDQESGLYYAKARYYDPKVARFASEDPEAGKDMTPPSLHRYLYAYANPTVWVDPTGGISFLTTAEEIGKSSVESYDEDIAHLTPSDSYVKATSLYLAKGFAETGSLVATGLNAAANLVARSVSDGSGGEEARQELAQSEDTMSRVIEGAANTASYVKEDPKGASIRVVNSGLEFGKELLSGDVRAVGKTAATVISFATGGAIAKLGKARALAEGVDLAAANVERSIVNDLEHGFERGGHASPVEPKIQRPSAASQSDLNFVQRIAAKAESTGVRQGYGPAGSGSAQGTWKHDYAKRLLERYQQMTGQKLDLLAENSYLGKAPASYGTAGSARPDVFNPVSGELFDYKFVKHPGRGLGSAQKAKNAANVPGVVRQHEINP